MLVILGVRDVNALTYLSRKGWSFRSCRICTPGILKTDVNIAFYVLRRVLTRSVERDDMVALWVCVRRRVMRAG